MSLNHLARDRRVAIAAVGLAAALTVAGCSAGKHKTADTTPSTASISGSASGSAAGSASGPASGSPSPGVSGGGVVPTSQASGGAGAASPAANLPQAQIQATASKTGLSVRLHAGQVLQVILPASAQQAGQATKYAVTPAGSAALTPIAGAPGFFTGAAPGTVKVVVTQSPECPAGSACPAHVVDVGSLTVVVWK
jgi:hypothetical protein